MKITSVDIVKAFKEPSVAAEVAVGNVPWHPVFVRINTDEGISGLGEVGVALWDIKGKALGVPCYKLLGGKTNHKLRAYASQLQFDWGKVSHSLAKPEEYAEAMRKAMADGFDAVKVDPVGFDANGVWMGRSSRGILQRDQMKLAVDRVAAMREVGPDVDIIIELHALTDATTSVQLGRELAKLGCFYYEEPTQPLNPNLFREISSKVEIPIAAGERMYTRWGYRQFFEDHSISIIQPDLCNTGGITEGKKICDMAHVYDIGVQVHCCGGPVSASAALQLEAVIPNFVIHELHASALIDDNIELCTNDFVAKDGYFEVPELPGIGQELTEKCLANAEIVTVK